MLILNKDLPSISLYYLGAKLIEFIDRTHENKFRLSSLYISFNEVTPISFNRFILVLDWLYILGLIIESEDGALLYVSQ